MRSQRDCPPFNECFDQFSLYLDYCHSRMKSFRLCYRVSGNQSSCLLGRADLSVWDRSHGWEISEKRLPQREKCRWFYAAVGAQNGVFFKLKFLTLEMFCIPLLYTRPRVVVFSRCAFPPLSASRQTDTPTHMGKSAQIRIHKDVWSILFLSPRTCFFFFCSRSASRPLVISAMQQYISRCPRRWFIFLEFVITVFLYK